MRRPHILLTLSALVTSGCLVSVAMAEPPATPHSQWVTLGTQGGPIPTVRRSQPANGLIRPDGGVVLVDAGDGAVEQLARAGYSLDKVDTVFLSHMHFDHTAGMLGVLGLLFQVRAHQIIEIYGPPGTKSFIDGLLAAMEPFAEGAFGIVGEHYPSPASLVKVTELTDGSTVQMRDVKVRAVQNSHYSFPPGSDLDRRFKSLSYRFDLADRSIVFTGDTGPSAAVTKLAQGADLLVSEMIDVPAVIAMTKRKFPQLKGQQFDEMVEHQETQHLQSEAIGIMAGKAGVKAIVLTHFAPGDIAGGDLSEQDMARYRTEIAKNYSGPIMFAHDLGKF